MSGVLGPIPQGSPIGSNKAGPVTLSSMWITWLSQLFNAASALGDNGTTAQRPTAGLYIGRDYFDATLGYKVTVKSLNPTVWVNGAGGVV